MSYRPTITQGIYPEDAGWTSENQTNILLISAPLLSEILSFTTDPFDYAWLYDEELDAYIFCFRLQNQQEYAILFQKEHAGRLLIEQVAYEEFSIVLTDQPFEMIKEETPHVTLSKISLKRQTIAGW
ncbi:hypothetical protein ACLM5H_13815 [Fredinandcohnia humi]